MAQVCRNCLTELEADTAVRRCPACHSPRLTKHAELFDLGIAHLDCDAFYASIEKRDDPSLQDKPVIIGGGKRGVVSTACYIARTFGVHSAQPMFKALAACPDAIVVRPNMEKYVAVGKEIRALMRDLTPLVEPLSLDEAFLDLTGTEKLHKAKPAVLLLALQNKIENELGLTVSVGLSYCKFLAKVGSDLDKPRGFSVIGRAEAQDFLAPQPVTLIWGVGKAMAKTLKRHGIHTISDLRGYSAKELSARYGSMGMRLYELSYGRDNRRVDPTAERKSISGEVTLFDDVSDVDELTRILWRQCERVAERAKAADAAGWTVVLKLKTADFKTITRNTKLHQPTQLADTLFRVGHAMLKTQADGRAFRLIGIGLSEMADPSLADLGDLADPDAQTRAAAEKAVDKIREKFGKTVIGKGRGLKQDK